MPKSAPFSRAVAIAAAAIASTASADESLELFMDTETKQIYAEPGPNRVRLGRFQPADESQGAAVQPSVESTLEQRMEQQEQKVAAIEQRDADTSRSPFNDRFQIRGYLQTRYTEMLGGDEGINLWSDRSVGDQNSVGDADKNYLIRRAR